MLRRFILVNILPILFLAVDAVVWATATPLGFQRFGSIAVLFAALIFGADRALRIRFPQRAAAQEQLIRAEVFLVALGTVQWGYGDLFHCWSNGQGWKIC